MRSTLSIISVCLVVGLAGRAAAQAPPYYWGHQIGNQFQEYGTGVAFDPSGNVYVTGYFQGTINIGGADLTSAGSYDILLAKYGANGVHQWSQRFGGPNDDRPLDIAVDNSGNVAITGTFVNLADFGGGSLVGLGVDIFVAKYDTDGLHQWSQRFGGNSTDSGNSIAFDASGNVLITGVFRLTANFGGSDLISAGDTDVCLAKLDASGIHQWSSRFGSTGADAGWAVAADATGNPIMTGSFNLSVSFGGSTLVSAGLQDIFVARYNTAGVHQFSSRFGSTGNDIGHGIAADGTDGIYMTAEFENTVSFGGANPLSSSGLNDIVLAKYNLSGIHQWSKRFGNTSNDAPAAVEADASGNTVLAGGHRLTIDFGGGPLPAGSDWDMFVAKFNSAGTHQWSRTYGSVGVFDYPLGLDMDATGAVALTGYFSGPVDFGGGAIVPNGFQDTFVAVFAAPDKPRITAITDVGNDQGHAVRISFLRAGHDRFPDPMQVVEYNAYRRIDALPAAMVIGGAATAPRERAVPGYEFAGTIPAFGELSYSMVVSTLADSTDTAGQHYSAFFVRAGTAVPTTFYDSPPDSGYSLDNLAPGVPQNFVYSTGELTWTASPDADFDHFTVYGSHADAFASATLVDYTMASSMDVTASPYSIYFVTATDLSGNEGKPAKVASSVSGTPKRYVLSVSNYPNPFNPRTTVSYTVPSRGRVTVSIYDTRGALVATLFNGERAAGAYSVDWDGRTGDAAGAASGIYFARIEHASGTRSKKMVLLK